MTPSEAAKLSRISQLTLERVINEFAQQFRPKILEQRRENGVPYTRYEAGYAEGYEKSTWIKPTSRGHGVMPGLIHD